MPAVHSTLPLFVLGRLTHHAFSSSILRRWSLWKVVTSGELTAGPQGPLGIPSEGRGLVGTGCITYQQKAKTCVCV